MRSIHAAARRGRAAAVCLAAVAASGGVVAVVAPAMAARAPVKSVKVADDYFVRSANNATVAVKKGTVLRFNFVGFQSHDVTVARGPVIFRSGRRSKGTYVKTVTKVGNYIIVCTIHPGMQMKLNVVK